MSQSAIGVSAVFVLIACGGGDKDAPGTGAPAGSGSAASGTQQLEQARAQIIATSAEAVGTVEVRRAGQVRWERVAVGATFRQRDWVRTGKGSFARLRFSTRGFIDLAENTTLLVDDSLTVESGMVAGVASGTDPFVVKTTDGTEARIASTAGEPGEFRLTPGADKGVEIAVTKGNVKVTTQAGELTVARGESTNVVGNRASEVVKLLAYPKSIAPGVDARFLFAANLTIALKWKPLEGAQRYHVQVARDTDFHEMLQTMETTTPDSSFIPDRVGMYAWRVAARDPNGRLGEFGFARRIYCEQDQPRDLLITPRSGAKLEVAKPPAKVEFSWRPEGDAAQYKLVLHRGVIGLDAPITTTTAAQQVALELDEGAYSWGVYTVDGDTDKPIFLGLRQLTITKVTGPKIRTEVQWK